MFISESDKQRILTVAEGNLVKVISEFVTLTKKGAELIGKCPKCGHEQGLCVSQSKQIFKCFHCNQADGNSAVSWMMKVKDKTYPEALKALAEIFGIILTEPEQKRKPSPKKTKKGKHDIDSFCAKMLEASGLTFDDVTANIYDAGENKTVFRKPAFFRGTVDSTGEIINDGDDVIIAYYDLDGFPVKYEIKDKKNKPTGKFREFFRVRWQYPEEHPGKDGKPSKYKTPYGAGTPIYIPEKVRNMYKTSQTIERLYIQEGEKKAEKACKHGITSIAISGIQNLGMNGRLPESVIKIIERCGVKEVLFMLDSDCFDLSHSLKVGDKIEKRPRNFFYAVRNYKDYFRSLKNREIYVEILFGYILKNEADDKGIDDLLTNSLAGKEDDLLQDIEYAVNEKSHTGKYVQLHKITIYTDHKLEEIWSLNSYSAFAQKYKNILREMPEFTIGQHRWRFNEKGELESTQPVEPDEQYWEELISTDRSGRERKNYEFRYGRCFTFLHNRGFGRYRRPSGDYNFVRIDTPFIKTVETWEIRDFITEFTKMIANEEVLEMIYRGGPQYIGYDKLSHLPFILPAFEVPERDKHIFYFAQKCWQVNKDGITEFDYSNIPHQLWIDIKKDFQAQRLSEPIIKINRSSDGQFAYTITNTGKKCHFLKFLENTSNFTWRKQQLIAEDKPDIIITPDELYDNTLHLIAKLCAIGYMITGAKDRNTAKAVVAMDGKQSEVNASNGRSGKSIIGELFKHVNTAVYINGKTVDVVGDKFVWDEVTEKTRTVFFDDVRPGFDFELLFANITGDWNINYKGGRKCTLPFTTSPKIYITTNHTLKGEGSSFLDRQWVIAFSDFYNDRHKPLDDFKILFFDEWDFEQWNLLWNLLAECVQLYFRFGCIESPQERIVVRRLRQNMGEDFLSWAEEYFSDTQRKNIRIARKDLYDSFLDRFPAQRKYCTATLFKKRIQYYCSWKGYKFNPQKYDPVTGIAFQFDKDGQPIDDDKSGGVEYFTIGDENYAAGFSIDDGQDMLTNSIFD
ncbi:MAG: DNA primase [Prevotellaceae bacterium]|jgi:ssDNA-binding Zn-finger/Zn-ribbon topoisomerase 1|nr:DNA primase [Prevotellaceae bacterium]